MKLFSKTIEEKRISAWRQGFYTLTVSKTIFGKYVIDILLKRFCDSSVSLRKQIFFLKTNKKGLFDALYLLNTKYPEFELDAYLDNIQ